MEQCPICKGFNVRIIHHYYDKSTHRTRKVFRCQICNNEWKNIRQNENFIYE